MSPRAPTKRKLQTFRASVRLIQIGQMMSNTLYNLAQGTYNETYKGTAKELYTQWDEEVRIGLKRKASR
jgi:hypothetical protein